MRDNLQLLAATGTGDTDPGFDFKQRAVGGALNQCFVSIQKLVFEPVQLHAQMRAGIAIDVNPAVAFYGKQAAAIDLETSDLETFGTGVGDIVNMTEREEWHGIGSQ